MHDGWFWRSEVRYSDYSKDARTETFGGAPFVNLNFDPVVETATNIVTGTFNTGVNPFWLACTPNGSYACVANRTGNTMSVVSLSSFAAVATVPVVTTRKSVAAAPVTVSLKVTV